MKRTSLVGVAALLVIAALAATPLSAGATGAVPNAATDVVAVPAGGQATVSWAPASTGPAAQWYRVIASPSTTIPAGCAAATTTSCSFTGLTNGTAYTFTVMAHNAAGVAPASVPSTPVTPINHPSAPAAVSATAVATSGAGGEIKVHWNPPLHTNGSAVTGYSVTSSPVVTPPAACTDTTATSCTFTGLTNGTAYTFSVTATNGAGTGPAATTQGTPVVVFPGSLSSNWSGYVSVTGAPVTEMAGEWVVPSLKCGTNSTTEKDTASWVGIGGAGYVNGIHTGNLLQTGTADFCDGSTQMDYAWTELLPAAESPFEDNNFLPQPGDHIIAKVWFNGTAWETDLTDVERGLEGIFIVGPNEGLEVKNLSTDKTTPVGGLDPQTPTSYKGGKSAEWIMEDPMGPNGLLPFPNFQSVTFSSLEVNAAQPSLDTSDGIALVNTANVFLSAPGAVVSNSFTCTFKPTGYILPSFAAALLPFGSAGLLAPAPLRTPSVQSSAFLRAS
jgi:hypothetical protein